MSRRPILLALAAFGLLAPDRSLYAQRLPLRHLTTADGLAGEDVRALVQDSRGYLWIGTTTGLSRFDGRSFRNYGPQEGLPDAAVHAILEDGDGRLWVGTARGLAVLDPAAAPSPRPFGPFDLPTDAPGEIRALLEDRQGRIWVGAGSQIYILEDRGGRITVERVSYSPPTDPPPGSRWDIMSLAETPDGSIWAGILWGLVRVLPDGQTIGYPVRPTSYDDSVTDLLVDHDGRLWIVHWGIAHRPGINWGLYVVRPSSIGSLGSEPVEPLHGIVRQPDPGEGSRSPLVLPGSPGTALYLTGGHALGDARVHSVYQSRDGAMWLATEGGLVHFENGRTRRFGEESGFRFSALDEILEDARGVLWIGSRGGGLFRYDPAGIVSYGERDGLMSRTVTSIFEDRAGHLCVTGVDAEGRRLHSQFDGKRFRTFTLGDTGWVQYWGWGWQQTVLQDREGEWWLPTGEGLLRYPATLSFADLASTRPMAVYTRSHGLYGDNLFRLFEDSRGDLWVGSFNPNGLTRWRRSTGRFETFPSEITGTPSAFAEDRAGNVWIGFYHGGLARYREGRFEHFGEKDGVPAGFVNHLHVDRAGRLWIASARGGVGRVDAPMAPRPRFTRYTIDEGLASNTILSIVEDTWGRLYVGTGRGVDRLDPTTGGIRRYSTVDGLANNFVRSTYRDRAGNVWLGTWQGLSRLVPRIDPPSTPPEVRIQGLSIAGVPRPVSELGAPRIAGLRIEPGEARLQVDFGGIELEPGEELQYQTRLAGVDREWSPPTRERTVLLANLGTGSYRLLVRAVNGEGLVSPEPAVVEFAVLPPLWRRPWFLLGTALLAGLGAMAVYRYRVNRLLQLERVRTRIATDLHDDLGSRLSRVSILSEAASRLIGRDDAEARRLLAEMGDTSRGLIEAAGDMAWSIDPRRDDVASLVARIRRFTSDTLDGRGIGWSFQAPPDGVDRRLTPEQRRHILLLFQEAIHNVVRHSGASRVDLTLSIEDGCVEVEIHDDGHGIPAAVLTAGSGGRGLHNMRVRAHALGGTLEIASEPGHGTRIRLRAPLARGRRWLLTSRGPRLSRRDVSGSKTEENA